MSQIIDNYHDVQQDILETFVDRGQLRKLAEPTTLPNGKRLPGLRLDHPQQLAVMPSLVRFAHIAAGGAFTMRDLYRSPLGALGRAKPNTRWRRSATTFRSFAPKGLWKRFPTPVAIDSSGRVLHLSVVLKLFERIYVPLTAGILKPFRGDRLLAEEKRCELDRLYQRLADDLDALLGAVGLKSAAFPAETRTKFSFRAT
jgi:hypothetical protein